MADKKWTPSAKLALALSKLDEQQGGKGIVTYGTDEHLAVVRYLVQECCDATGKLDRALLKAEFGTESAFLGYASNGKKMLIAAKLLPDGGAKAAGYE